MQSPVAQSPTTNPCGLHMGMFTGNKIKIEHHVYYVEKFVHKPRAVKSNRCQKFGHKSRLCRSAKPTCAKLACLHVHFWEPVTGSKK